MIRPYQVRSRYDEGAPDTFQTRHGRSALPPEQEKPTLTSFRWVSVGFYSHQPPPV